MRGTGPLGCPSLNLTVISIALLASRLGENVPSWMFQCPKRMSPGRLSSEPEMMVPWLLPGLSKEVLMALSAA